MNKAFLDTNLLIAWVFFLNSLHSKSNSVFEQYDELFWSSFVRYEFNRRFFKKQNNIKFFFKELQKYFENPEQALYSSRDLKNFVLNNFSGKIMEDAQSSILPFWNEYFGFQTQVPFDSIKDAINFCLNDLSITSNKLKKGLDKSMNLTPLRTKSYSKIDKLLKNEGVKDADRRVTLDGHDFACFNSDPIDFVTFDEDCFNGANNVGILCFDSIKGKYDFNS